MDPTTAIERYLALISDPAAELEEIDALDAPPFAAGSQLRADSSMHFVVRDGRIVHQENFDCFEGPSVGPADCGFARPVGPKPDV